MSIVTVARVDGADKDIDEDSDGDTAAGVGTAAEAGEVLADDAVTAQMRRASWRKGMCRGENISRVK